VQAGRLHRAAETAVPTIEKTRWWTADSDTCRSNGTPPEGGMPAGSRTTR